MARRGSAGGVALGSMPSVAAACLLVAWCFGCSGKHGPQVGGDSHWLAACLEDVECGGEELSCVCGTCTKACARDASCSGGVGAACYDRGSPLLLQRCEDRSSAPSHGICLPTCKRNADCGARRACAQGACVPAAESDAGTVGATQTAQPTVQISDFAGVDAAVSWSQPVAVPTRSEAIVGADASLLACASTASANPRTTSASRSISRARTTGSRVKCRSVAHSARRRSCA